MGRKLYVGNFPYETGEAELQDLFARAGTVETVKVMRDMATGRARGFAFVEMSTEDEAQKAIAELNEYQLGAQSLRQRSAAEDRVWRRVRRRRVAASLRAALSLHRVVLRGLSFGGSSSAAVRSIHKQCRRSI